MAGEANTLLLKYCIGIASSLGKYVVSPARVGDVSGVSRRSFLLGSVFTSAFALSGCGENAVGKAPELVGLFNSSYVIVAGKPQRIPFAAVSDDGNISIPDDAELPVSIFSGDTLVGEYTVKAHVVDHDHVGIEKTEEHTHTNLYRYFPLRATLPEAGIFDVRVTFYSVESSFTMQAFDVSEVDVILPGDKFPSIETPVAASDGSPSQLRGVDTICSRSVDCGLHSISVADLLKEQKSFVFLIATPAFCSTAYCGPVLETLLSLQEEFSEVEMVHAEVFANAKAVGGNYADPQIRFAPFFEDLGLSYEPVLFVVDGSGVVVDRLDNVFDRRELQSVLSSLLV